MRGSQQHASRQGPGVLLAVSWFYPAMNKGVIRFAQEHGWRLAVDPDEQVPPYWRGDGIITLLGAGQTGLYRDLRRFGVPIVDLTESRPRIQIPRVCVDNAAIGRMAARHFLDRGFRHFAYVHRWELGVGRRRRDAFLQELETAGMSARVIAWQRELSPRENTYLRRHSRLIRILRETPRPLAVFASRDGEAIEVIEACLAAGLDVPRQVSVLGVDNSDYCESLAVPLSSIDSHQEQVGYQGAALLDQLLRGARLPRRPIYVPPGAIVQRRSTDSLAVEHPRVEAALRFIHEHAHEPIQMPDVVRHVCMSRSGLEKAFREHYVRPPMQELRRVRFERARRLLATTRRKIAAIAWEAGFRTPHHLCRVFQSELGMTPREYRARHSKDR